MKNKVRIFSAEEKTKMVLELLKESVRQNSISPIGNRVLWQKVIAKSIRK